MVITRDSIVLVQQKSKRGVRQLVTNTNFQNLTLAAIFYFASLAIGPVYDALFIHLIPSVFHIISYFQRHLIDFIDTLPQQQQLESRVAAWLEENQPKRQNMAATASLSLVLMSLYPIVVKPTAFANLVAGRWQVALTYLICFAASMIFAKLSWNENPCTKQEVSKFDAEFGSILQRFPPLAYLYHKVRNIVVKVLAPITINVPQQSPGEQAQDSLKDASPRDTTSDTSH
ncbi:hypothetical protein DIURU_003122 [Diutina rugosa]|uniref:Uncharacterized protein n=1 Tax=Diutina rugosa TaxID=5481 RepID=A0A642URE2_DIURU|nr:uncharacterized protein DIURU_003122 [Diutina rugosa]KAA8901594.1 hypothetical protein DIURU_003122 [Diutina rugosa]